MKKSKLISSLLSAAIMITAPFSVNVSSADDGNMRDITTTELVRDMGIGINLGNTMESCGDWIGQYGDGSVKSYETAWGSPEITKEMIDGYADEGFGVLRIPVAWSNLMSTDGNYTINSEYLKRVHQLVDWTLDTGMYAIINLHYDSGWLHELPEKKDECMAKYTAIWNQVSDSFKDYGDHLMFESQNEELGWDSLWNRWGGTEGKDKSYQLVNEVNQKFVDIIRSSGGNNPKRHLLISGYATDIELTCDPLFVMPDDPANRCAVSVHYYTPAGFAILEEDADWAACRTTWGTDEDFTELQKNMDMMKTNFVDKGVPVIIGEYGCPKKNKDADSVRLFLSSVCSEAYERELCPVLWDITELHYNRQNCKLYDEELKAKFNSIYNKNDQPTDPTEAEKILGDVNNDESVNIADVALLSKYLVKENALSNYENADLDENSKINVIDLVLLKRNIVLS